MKQRQIPRPPINNTDNIGEFLKTANDENKYLLTFFRTILSVIGADCKTFYPELLDLQQITRARMAPRTSSERIAIVTIAMSFQGEQD